MSLRPQGRGAAAAAAMMLALACPAGARAGVHTVATIHAVGGGTTAPSRIATGDFDGNGVTDLVASGISAGGGDVSILPGLGRGAFGAPRVFAASARPRDVAVADFDEDGFSDVVLPADTAPFSVTVQMNDGNGVIGFTATTIALPAAALAVATGDFNGDGHSDIAVGDAGGAIRVIPGVGDGTFGVPLPPVVTGGGAVAGIAAGDVDGNGRDDVVVAPGPPSAGAPTVATLLSAANGTLAAPVATTVPGAPLAPRVGDLNGDGRADVVVTSPAADAASVLLAAPGGGLGAPVSLPVARGGTAAIGDVNADGRPDLVVAGNPAGLTVFFGRGDGTFGAGVPVASAGAYSSAVAADLDGDGFADLALGRPGDGRVVVGLNAPSAVPDAGSVALPTTGVGATSATRAVTITNDGQPPLHVAGAGLGGANPGDFVVAADGCSGLTLPAGGRCTVTVAMRPGAGGVRSADLAIASDSAEGAAHVALAGTGVAPGQAVAADRVAPLVGVTVRAQRLRTVLRHGLRATVSCTEPCTADVRLVLPRALARRYGLARRSAPTVAHRTVRLLRPGRLPVRLHLTRRAARALRNAPRITFTLRTVARDAAGNARLRTTSVALLR
jgi:hypothetical protein